MHALRLNRLQNGLQSHQIWLKNFLSDVRPTSNRGSMPVAGRLERRPNRPPHRHFSQARVLTRQRKHPQHQPPAVTIENLSLYQETLNAIEANDYTGAFGSYNKIRVSDKARLSERDVTLICQRLRFAIRRVNQDRSSTVPREEAKLIIDLITRVSQDVTGGKLVPSPTAYKHILGAFQEAGQYDAGAQFWRWLETQEDEYLSHDVYAAAIELLAFTDTPLPQLEEIFATSLTRFPGTFLAYHLSPSAIVSDRERKTSINDIPVLLLHAIMTARLVRGNVRDAYMALDTLLRLSPTTFSQRTLTLFIQQRPVAEAFTVFAMACRSGQCVGSSAFKQLLAVLRTSSILVSLPRHIAAVRALLVSMYLYLAAGGRAGPNLLSELVIAITHIVRLPGTKELDPTDRQEVVDHVLRLVKKIFASLARYGVVPNENAFNSIIIDLGGYGGSHKIIRTALADMEMLGSQPSAATRRSVVTAAGLLGDEALVAQGWRKIVEERAQTSSFPRVADFIVLLRATRNTSMKGFAHQQYHAFKTSLSAMEIIQIEEFMSRPTAASVNAVADNIITSESLLESIRTLDCVVDAINEQTRDRPHMQDFSSWPPRTRLLPNPTKLSIPESEMRQLYDEFSTEPGPTSTLGEAWPEKHSNEALEGPDVSETNVSFGSLRYENWKDINYLLSLAEENDRKYAVWLEASSSAGEKPRVRHLKLLQSNLRAMAASDLPKVAPWSEAEDINEPQRADVKIARAEILRLRGVTLVR